jgi:hypothetical protein
MCGFGSERSRPQCKEIRGALVILSGQVLFFLFVSWFNLEKSNDVRK